MRFCPVQPARVTFDEDGTPMAPDFGDAYHSRAGALAQAQAVFLQGNGLPQRWRGRSRFVILETGFGLGQNFLAAWQAWAQDPQAPGQLWFVSVEKHPVPRAAAQKALAVHQGTNLQDKAQALLEAWPAASPDLFRSSFEGGRVVLQVVHADVTVALRELKLQADALFLDGFTPRLNPDMWNPHVFKALSRLVSPDCTAATWSTSPTTVKGLIQAGFDVERRTGFADKPWCLAARLSRPRPARPHKGLDGATSPSAPPWRAEDGPVVILGAGLAGAACAQALSACGIPSLVLDRHAQPAAEASGNPAGLFHGVLHPADGTHARLGRAAAWMAQRHYAPLIHSGLVAGQAAGLLRLEDQGDVAAMQAQIDALGLPPDYVQALNPTQVQALMGEGLALQAPAWFYPGGGWLCPGDWVRHALACPGVQFRGDTAVQSLQRDARGWRVVGPNGQLITLARHIVVCSAGEALNLLPSAATEGWPVGLQRGQITRIPGAHLPGPGPSHPISGSGYALGLPQGDLLCGATTQAEDADPTPRLSDHLHNLQRMNRLLKWNVEPPSHALAGRVGWRFHAADRLPIVGPVGAGWSSPLTAPSASSPTTPHGLRLRDMPMEPGLYTATGLGSRGITWAPLVGAVIAAWIAGEPFPLPNSLGEAIDPRRFALKRPRSPASARPATSPAGTPMPGGARTHPPSPPPATG